MGACCSRNLESATGGFDDPARINSSSEPTETLSDIILYVTDLKARVGNGKQLSQQDAQKLEEVTHNLVKYDRLLSSPISQSQFDQLDSTTQRYLEQGFLAKASVRTGESVNQEADDSPRAMVRRQRSASIDGLLSEQHRELLRMGVSAADEQQLKKREKNFLQRRISVLTAVKKDKGTETSLTAEMQKLFLSWDFDAFAFCRNNRDRSPLVLAVVFALEELGLLESLKLDLQKVIAFVRVIGAGYKPNQYHNMVHATDVVQATLWFLRVAKCEAMLTPIEMFAIVIAAALHDYDHPGVNNAFHCATMSELAMQFNDKSVLENHHLCEAFKVMMVDETNILIPLDPANKKRFRECVVEMVLATDMAYHLDLVNAFKSIRATKGGFDKDDAKDRLLLLKVVLHCADLSNPTRKGPIADQWSLRVMAEFFAQGDEERERGLMVSPFMDKTASSIPGCQTGFMKFIVIPLFTEWRDFASKAGVCLENLEQNVARWEKRKQEEEKAMGADKFWTHQEVSDLVNKYYEDGGE
mmetsp:Transcript_1732/g.6019  ORF Transcript_1732/g.6019 Transcript_1732/m.6019 type:complete len:527 (-) Transcript_1732:2013-3593(-)